MASIVDTNVLKVASKLAPHADDRCVATSTSHLALIMREGGLLLDDKGLILTEYLRNLGYSGQPGPGHIFAKWAHDHQAIAEQVTKVVITPRTDHGWRRFDEFPDNSALSAFDKSDQKFVAVALASGLSPPILNAVDSDWANFDRALRNVGVTVAFLC